MAAMIVSEIWDDKMEKWETLESFDTFAVFFAHALKFREGQEPKRLRVHIPGGFPLTNTDLEKLNALGIERL